MIIKVLISLILSYFLGAIPFGYIVGKKICHVNLLEAGSKNVGATNTFRVLGARYGVIVFLLDFFKGFFSAYIGLILVGPVLSVFCGLMAVLGHTFSCFLHFKGGKGVATGAGMMLCWCPPAILLALLVWVVILLFSGYVSLASMIASACCFLFLIVFGGSALEIVICGLIVAYIIFKHRPNISRLCQGTESRFNVLDKLKKKS